MSNAVKRSNRMTTEERQASLAVWSSSFVARRAVSVVWPPLKLVGVRKVVLVEIEVSEDSWLKYFRKMEEERQVCNI